MSCDASVLLEADVVLNCRGLNCPLPVVYTRHQLGKMEAGQVVQVIATDPGVVEDMTEFSEYAGYEILSHIEDAGDFIFFLRK